MTTKKLKNLIFWARAESKEWQSFIRQAQKMLKDKGKKESKMTKF